VDILYPQAWGSFRGKNDLGEGISTILFIYMAYKKTTQELVAEYCQSPKVLNGLVYVNGADCFCEYDETKCYYKVLKERDINTNVYNYLCVNQKSSITDHTVRDFVKQMKYRIYRKTDSLISEYIALRNKKLLNVNTFLLESAHLDKYAFSYVDCDPELFTRDDVTMPPLFLKYLDDVLVTSELKPDKDLQMLVQEIIGYCLIPSIEAHATFFLVGKGRNGKSVLLKLLQTMVGKEFVDSMSIEKLTTNSFAAANLVGKKINMCAEEESTYIKSDKFKAMVSGDPISVERKYGESFVWEPTVKYIFATNEMPTFTGLNHGLISRIKIIPFNRVIKVDDIDTQMATKLLEHIDKIAVWAIQGAKRLAQNKYRFTECAQAVAKLEVFQENISAAILFFNEKYELGDEADFFDSEDLYTDYTTWCDRRGKKKQSYYSFYKDLENKYGEAIETIKKPNEEGIFIYGRPVHKKYERVEPTLPEF